MLIGPSGVGKSNFLKILTGVDVYIGHDLNYGTSLYFYTTGPEAESTSGTAIADPVSHVIDGTRFFSLDIPGFGHPQMGEKK